MRALHHSRLVTLLTLGAVMVVGLGGCGYSPLMANRQGGSASGAAGNQLSASANLNAVRIENIPERVGQKLRNELVNRFYTASNRPSASHALSITLSFNDVDLGIRKDATAARGVYVGTANFRLTELGSGRVVASGSLESRASYNRVEAQYALLAAQQNAEERTVLDLANRLTLRIAAALQAPTASQ